MFAKNIAEEKINIVTSYADAESSLCLCALKFKRDKYRKADKDGE